MRNWHSIIGPNGMCECGVDAEGKVTHCGELLARRYSVEDIQEIVSAITAIVREADEGFQETGGTSRHWALDWFLPLLYQRGWRLEKSLEEPRSVVAVDPVGDDAVGMSTREGVSSSSSDSDGLGAERSAPLTTHTWNGTNWPPAPLSEPTNSTALPGAPPARTLADVFDASNERHEGTNHLLINPVVRVVVAGEAFRCVMCGQVSRAVTEGDVCVACAIEGARHDAKIHEDNAAYLLERLQRLEKLAAGAPPAPLTPETLQNYLARLSDGDCTGADPDNSCDDVFPDHPSRWCPVCLACNVLHWKSVAYRDSYDQLKALATKEVEATVAAQAQQIADLTHALKTLRTDANRLCDRQLGGSYEDDCRAAIKVADRALAGSRLPDPPQEQP